MKLINKTVALFIFVSMILSQSEAEKMFDKSFNFLDKYYVDSIDRTEIIRSAIEGMVDPLDPYTKLIIDSNKDNLDMLTKGEYGGIGIRIGTSRDTLTVLSTMPGGPAHFKLKSGDQIIKIDEVGAIGKTTKEASKLIKGKLGTIVELYIKRPGEGLSTIDIERAKIDVNNIGYWQVDENSIGYIKINKFSKNISQDFIKSLKVMGQEDFIDSNGDGKWTSEEVYRDSNNNGKYDLGERYVDKNKNESWDSAEHFIDLNGNGKHDDSGKLKGLVIDLRGNSGGLLSEATKMLNALIDKNKVILYTKGRNGKILKKFKSTSDPILSNQTPIAILVNQRSASASEILSGVVQDLDRGVVIGRTTFGKGLVQKIKHLNDTTSLKVTYAKYYIPSGRLIQKEDWLDNGILTDGKNMRDSIFYTINTGRKVEGGGGVTPDILIESDKWSAYLGALNRQNLFLSFAAEYLSDKANYKSFESRLIKSLNKYMPNHDKLIDYVFTPAAIPDDLEYLEVSEYMINEIEIIDSKILKSFEKYIESSDYEMVYDLPGEEELESFKEEILKSEDLDQGLFLSLFSTNPEKMIKKIENYYAKKKKNQFNNKNNRKIIIKMLEKEFARYLFGEEVRVGVSLREDNAYIEAVELIKDEQSYKLILGY